jgi:hypothetical protein
VGLWEWFGGQSEPWRRLVDRDKIVCLDENTGDTVDIRPSQDDPTDIEGVLIGFAYTDAGGRQSRRVILCWQCWTEGVFTYVRGYCPQYEALRTFRIDRMRDLEEVRSGRSITDCAGYFASYAAERRDISMTRPPPSTWRPSTDAEIEADAFRRHMQHRARHQCIAGLRVLAYLALADDVRGEEERTIETSFIEARLAMCGFDRDPEMTSALVDVARALAVPPRSYAMAVNAIAKDDAYYRLVLSCAHLMVDFGGRVDVVESAAPVAGCWRGRGHRGRAVRKAPRLG